MKRVMINMAFLVVLVLCIWDVTIMSGCNFHNNRNGELNWPMLITELFGWFSAYPIVREFRMNGGFGDSSREWTISKLISTFALCSVAWFFAWAFYAMDKWDDMVPWLAKFLNKKSPL